jgi:AAA ATPase domain
MVGRTSWVWRVFAGYVLASGGAVVGWWLEGRQAAWLGVAVGAVTGGFAPSLVAWAKDRAEARQGLSKVSELPIAPASLLDPRRELVKFVGRDAQLDTLVAWCESGRPRGVRLVTGPGGVGKTRLSVELRARLEPRHWRCVPVGDQAEASALTTVRQTWTGRVLLVVDYAETRSGLQELLRVAAADLGVVRILLLARSTGEWWDRLSDAEPAVRQFLAEAGTGDPLPVAVDRVLSNDDLFSAAIPVFAAALGVSAPSGVSLHVPSHQAVRILDLHAAALVAVLQSPDVKKTVSVTGVLDELLSHEQRFWQGTAKRLGLLAGPKGMTVSTLRNIVAVGALLGAASQTEAVKLLRRVPHAVASAKVASWLRQMYPPDLQDGGEQEWLGTLSPDRLAEHLVVRQLSTSGGLAGRCLTGLNERQSLRAVTLLGRAAADQPTAKMLLEWTIPLLLEQAVPGLPTDLGLLVAIADAIPDAAVG